MYKLSVRIKVHTNPDIDPTWYPDVIETSNASFTEEAPFNTTEHRGKLAKSVLMIFCLPGFLHGFVESFSVILVSEIGDKTFFTKPFVMAYR